MAPRKTTRNRVSAPAVSAPQPLQAPTGLHSFLLTDLLRLDAIQSRVNLSPTRVEEFTTRYREHPEVDDLFDPLEVFMVDGVPHLAGGFHRCDGALAAGRTTHLCRVHHGTLRDAMIFAIRDNVNSILPYSSGDKERIIVRLLADPEYGDHARWSDRALGREFGISNVYVSRLRNRLETAQQLMAEVETVLSPPPDGEVLTVNTSETTIPPIDTDRLATYLGVDPDVLQRATSNEYYTPARIVRQLATSVADHQKSLEEAKAEVLQEVTRRGALPEPPAPRAPRPRLSPEERQARQEMKEREEAEHQAREREREWDDLRATLRHVAAAVRGLSPRPMLDDGNEGAPDYAGLFACIPETPHNRGQMTRLLGEAFEAVQGLKTAWESRTK